MIICQFGQLKLLAKWEFQIKIERGDYAHVAWKALVGILSIFSCALRRFTPQILLSMTISEWYKLLISGFKTLNSHNYTFNVDNFSAIKVSSIPKFTSISTPNWPCSISRHQNFRQSYTGLSVSNIFYTSLGLWIIHLKTSPWISAGSLDADLMKLRKEVHSWQPSKCFIFGAIKGVTNDNVNGL